MKYPAEAVTLQDKLEYAYACQEALRLDHNKHGDDFRSGKLSGSDWKSYKDTKFRPKQVIITEEICKLKDQLKSSTRFTIDLDNLE